MSTINSSSSSTSTYNSGSTMRITGMASGMDIDGLVKSMLAPDQNKIDEASKQQQTYQWKQEAYQSIIKDVKDLQSSFFDITSSNGSMTSASNYLALSAVSADPTVVNTTVTADAVTGTYTMDVTNTAKNAKLTGTKSINGQINVSDFLNKTTTQTLKFALNDDPSNPASITLPANITSASNLINSINTQISSNSKLNGNVSASLVTDNSGNSYIKFNSSPYSQVATLNLKDISNSIELNNGWNGKNIKLSDGTTGDDLTLSIDSTFSGSIDDLVTTLNDKLSATTNYKDLTVSNDNGKLKFTNASKTKAITIAPAAGNSIPDLGSGLTIASNNGTAETTTFGKPDFSGWVGKDITFDVNGTSKTVNLSGPISDANGLASALQSAIGNSDVQVTATGNSIKFSTTNAATISLAATDVVDLNSQSAISNSANIKLSSLVTDKSLNTNLCLNIKYDGQDIAVNVDNSKGNKTIGDLAQAINTATGGKVTAVVDDISGQFTLKTSDTGAVASLQIEGAFDSLDANGHTITNTPTQKLLDALGFETTGTGTDHIAQGSDANVKITQPDGTITTLTETSNSFTVNGITYNLVGAQKSTTITVNSDSQDVYDKISKFLDKYNTVIDEIQTKLQEKKDYDYPPLTDAQKSSMNETQIKAWEDKAKKGILRNDDNLQNLLNDLRKAFTTPLTDSSGNRIVSLNFGKTGTGAIGIDTSDSYSDGDKITIQDAQKLKDAISKNSSQLVKLFTNVSSTDSFNDSGIFQRINKVLKDNVGMVGTSFNSSILTKYANVQDDYSVSGGMGEGTIPDKIYTQQLLVKKYKAKYTTDQTNYYNKFSKLEALMTQLSSQQASLSAMLGS